MARRSLRRAAISRANALLAVALPMPEWRGAGGLRRTLCALLVGALFAAGPAWAALEHANLEPQKKQWLIEARELLLQAGVLPMMPGAWGNPQPKVVVLTNASGATWSIPADFNDNNNTVEGQGPGAKASAGGPGNTTNGGAGGTGAGGGAYTKLTNWNHGGAASVAISIPLGTSATPGDTNFASGALIAKGASTSTGGAAASCTPAGPAQSGGNGAAGGAAGVNGGVGGGGAGAAGPTGAGASGSGQTHGGAGTGTFADGTTRQGAGADGANAPGQDLPGIGGGAGSNYGGGGGGGSGGGQAISAGTRAGGAGGKGGDGLILIRYISLF